MKLSLIHCGLSNLTSVTNALIKVGHAPELIQSPPKEKTDFLVMPGVGVFEAAINRLTASGMADYIKEHIQSGRPFLGLCVGMQILFTGSEESPGARGLAIFPESFSKLRNPTSPDMRHPPNIGYNHVEFSGSKSAGFSKLSNYYYFLHSYALTQKLENADVLGTSMFNDQEISAFFIRENVCGIQYHPERSAEYGQQLLTKVLQHLKQN